MSLIEKENTLTPFPVPGLELLQVFSSIVLFIYQTTITLSYSHIAHDNIFCDKKPPYDESEKKNCPQRNLSPNKIFHHTLPHNDTITRLLSKGTP